MQRLRRVAHQLEAAPTSTDRYAELSAVPLFTSSWDDLLENVTTPEQWSDHRDELRVKYLRLLRDEHAPSERPPLDLKVEEEVEVDGMYRRQLISYNVEADERAHAYLGTPLGPFLAHRDNRSESRSVPAVVALHGTYVKAHRQFPP